MTNREFYATIINSAISDELTEFATNAIAKLDEKNAKRTSKPSKTAIANEPIKVKIVAYLKEHSKCVASEIATALAISTQKASALCRQLVESGTISVCDIKVKGKGSVKAYFIESEEEEDGE